MVKKVVKKPVEKVVKKVVKVVKPVAKKPVVKPEVKPKVQPVVELKEVKAPALKSESYCGVKILSIKEREDGNYDVVLANDTSTVLDPRQYKIDVK